MIPAHLRPAFLKACFAALLLAPSLAAAARPNIVFILADDLGYTDLGCLGSRYYETPHLDRLAAQGMTFTNFHQCANCAPSRACMMSGQYPTRTGIYTVSHLDRGSAANRRMNVPKNVTQLPLDRQTIADQLRAAGYRTGLFGKWHLGKGDYHPAKRGFDEAIVVDSSHFGFQSDPDMPVPAGAYDGDWLTDRAVDFIERHQAGPFFLYLSHKLVHTPLEAKPELEAKYAKKPAARGHNHPTYAAMIASVDQSAGRIMAKLDELGLANNTVLLFASDNGGLGGYGDLARNITDNAPLRGGKGQHYEGGLRVPFLVRWPGVVAPGAQCAAPTVHVDLYSTFLEIAGAPQPRQTIDGISLVPQFRDPAAALGREAIYGHLPGYLEGSGGRWRTTPVGHILKGDWKLLEFFEDGRFELYNLRDDPSEQHDLAASMPGQARALRAQLAAWRAATGAAMPTLKTATQLQADQNAKPNQQQKPPKKSDL